MWFGVIRQKFIFSYALQKGETDWRNVKKSSSVASRKGFWTQWLDITLRLNENVPG